MTGLMRPMRMLLIVALLALPDWGAGSIVAAAWSAARDGSGSVRPEFADTMQRLRPAIRAAARRHAAGVAPLDAGRFAVVIAAVLYNEHLGWLEDALPPLQVATPTAQRAQIALNLALGTDLTVWPTNLRPSVVAEMLRHELPLADGRVMLAPVLHSALPADASYARITHELIDAPAAVEYLAANLERGAWRARAEGVPVTWQALAAWHNQGIVAPAAIAGHPAAAHYLRRAARYIPRAEALLAVAATHDAFRWLARPGKRPLAWVSERRRDRPPPARAAAQG
ncbi:MAG: hypothetical protein KGS47_08385 [Chloroflexi bacterium]|nr:hypothetical protein [Chloroflexota bacterium]